MSDWTPKGQKPESVLDRDPLPLRAAEAPGAASVRNGAPFFTGYALKGLTRRGDVCEARPWERSEGLQSTSAALGKAATRLDAFVAAGGLFTYGTYIEGLIKEQESAIGLIANMSSSAPSEELRLKGK